MIETTRPELVAYQEERLAKFVNENQKLDKGQIVFAGDSITEFFALKKYLGRDVFITVCCVLMGAYVIWLHRSNIQRLKNGTEYRFGEKKKENQ